MRELSSSRRMTRTEYNIWRATKLAKAHWWRALLILVLFVAMYWAIWPGDSPEWAGFRPYRIKRETYHADSSNDTREETIVREKKLWDWLELLIIPAVLASGAALLTNARTRADREAAEDKQREDRLQTYHVRMTELLLRENDEGLRESKPEDVIRDIARSRTLSTLRTLDGTRKGLLLRFLHESQLINVEGEEQEDGNPIVSLQDANLKGVDLEFAILRDANLRGADLRDADLGGANLRGADLRDVYLMGAELMGALLMGASLMNADLGGALLMGAILSGAFLRDANLSGADLMGAELRFTDLKDANLESANLSKANLNGAKVTEEQLAQAASLEGATMPDGTVHE